MGKYILKFLDVLFVGARVQANLILMLLDAKPREKILDAGFGLHSFTLAENNANVVAVDIDENLINMTKEWAKQLGFSNVRFEVQDICKLPYEDNSFDKILCSAVIEHISDDEAAISELVGVFKVGGRLVLTTPTPVSSQTCFFHKDTAEAVRHVREGYTPEELFELLESKGLLITDHLYYDRFFERFAYEIQTFLFRRAGGLDRWKEAYLNGSISNILHLLPLLVTFPPLLYSPN